MIFSSLKNESGFISKALNNKLVRFFMSAGIATLADVIIYFFVINFLFEHQRVYFGVYSASAHTLSLCVSYSCGVAVNFAITKYAVFNESTLAGKKQFSRFALIAFIGFFANYGLLRLFVEVFDFYPTPSRITSALSLGIAAYYIHKFFTFKIEST